MKSQGLPWFAFWPQLNVSLAPTAPRNDGKIWIDMVWNGNIWFKKRKKTCNKHIFRLKICMPNLLGVPQAHAGFWPLHKSGITKCLQSFRPAIRNEALTRPLKNKAWEPACFYQKTIGGPLLACHVYVNLEWRCFARSLLPPLAVPDAEAVYKQSCMPNILSEGRIIANTPPKSLIRGVFLVVSG